MPTPPSYYDVVNGLTKAKNMTPPLHTAQMAIWYITWGVLAYVMTLGKANRQARDWVFTGQIVMLAVEVAIVTTPGGDGVLPSWLFSHMAEYEVRGRVHAALLRACFL